MATERPAVEDAVLTEIKALRGEFQTEIKALREEIQAFRLDTHGRLSRLEGGFEQMDKRMGDTSSLQKWAIGLIITSWFTIFGMFLAILSRLR
ncbi:MAG: hypothetical protein EXS64_20215 [Candidatus Latescibacteria bacterium]|nr:hypothetical protein [Candidatus Latescibacterota bacterium]